MRRGTVAVSNRKEWRIRQLQSRSGGTLTGIQAPFSEGDLTCSLFRKRLPQRRRPGERSAAKFAAPESSSPTLPLQAA
ncbi:hypothetical protein PAL_GLEAN10024245 [Pteropus alecto]|uniref:Uncharacterized protein n=1 Tax=Pteropus alecto TaxID=9402 RepID=L5JXC7_PTEAL|nr:hypothetical protein PAL_GLEAN10024245 [Pteropus alecto]